MAKRGEQYIFVSDRKVHKKHHVFLTVLIVLATLILSVALINFIINNQVEMKSTKITVQNLNSDLENFSILLMSDLNGADLGSDQSAIKEAIGTLNCSCIVFAGDMVGADGNTDNFLKLVSKLPESITKLYLPGDKDPTLTDPTAHGSLSAYADWAQRLVEAGVQILDEPVMMTRGKHNIWFVPEYLYNLDLDSLEAAYSSQIANLDALGTLTADQAAQRRVAQYQVDRVERIREVQSTITSDDIQVAVTHTPLSQDYLTTMFDWNEKSDVFSLRSVSLILAGHYCAGTVRLPGLGAVYVDELGWFPDDSLITGLSYLHSIPQFITPGLGAEGLAFWQKFRIFNPPVINMIYLTSKIV